MAAMCSRADLMKYLTAQAAHSPDLTNGIPAGWPIHNVKVADDYKLTERDVEAGWQLLPDDQFQALRDALRPAYNSYKASLVEDYYIPRALLIKRLTKAEYKAIRAAFQASVDSADPDFAMLWDSIGAGITGPPDGYNEDRKLCRQVRNALRDIVGISSPRLDRIFAQP